MANGSETKQVIERTEIITLSKEAQEKTGILKLELKKIAHQEGKNSPVTHWATPIVEVAGSEMPLGRSFQVMFRVRPPQVQSEDKKWSDDPKFPEKMRSPETLKVLGAELQAHISK